MITSKAQTALRLTKEDIKCIDELMNHFGENRTDIIKRGITLLHYIIFTKNNHPPIDHLIQVNKKEE